MKIENPMCLLSDSADYAKQNGSTYHKISIYCHICILYDRSRVKYEQKYMVNSPHKEIGGTYEDCRRADQACQT